MQKKIIKMKYRGECHRCLNNLPEGTEVYWTKGVGVKCIEDCPKRHRKGPTHRWTSIRRGKAD